MDHWGKMCVSRVQSISVGQENVLCLNMRLPEGNYKLSKTWQLRTLEFTGRNFTEKAEQRGSSILPLTASHVISTTKVNNYHSFDSTSGSTWCSCSKQSQDSEDRRAWSSEQPCNSWDWLELEWHAVRRKRSTTDPKATGMPTPVFNSHTTPTSWDLPPTNRHK